jgi:hypothetical protein
MYVVRLKGSQINGNEISCTGEQLVIILNVFKSILARYKWFAADLTTNNGALPLQLRGQVQPFLVGNIQDLIRAASNIDQLFSGVFLAIPESAEGIKNRKFWDTEDIPNEEDIELSDLEIHAFDTTYFEIFAKEPFLLEKLCEFFQVFLETCEDK